MDAFCAYSRTWVSKCMRMRHQCWFCECREHNTPAERIIPSITRTIPASPGSLFQHLATEMGRRWRVQGEQIMFEGLKENWLANCASWAIAFFVG